MLSSQIRHATASRKHDSKHHESDPDRLRQAMTASQKYTAEYGSTSAIPDRQYRPSRRPDISGNPLPSESAPPTNKYSNARDQSFASGPSHYVPSLSQYQPAGMATTAGPSVAPRSRAHEQGPELDIHAYAKRRTERQSPRSSEEKLYGIDQGKPSRQSRQPGGTYPASTPLAGPPVNSSSLYQSSRDPVSSSRHHRDRDRDREKDRERRKEREREKERMREEEEERVRAKAAMIEELGRQKKREEKEARRAERAKEKERERRREEKEQERARRHREKERAREHEARTKDEPRHAARNSVYVQQPTTLASRQLNGSTDQVPSSSSNVALPHVTAAQATSGTRPHATTDPRRDEVHPSSHTVPPHVPEKDRKSRRSHRDKALVQQYAQESGMSSSEQEHSGKERASLRTVDRRYARREPETDVHGSGPSGSENERAPSYKQKRKHRAQDQYVGYRPHPSMQTSGAVPPSAQYSATVGPASSQHVAPRIVSIRAGQGPADPETPLMRTKTPFAASGGQALANPSLNYSGSSHGVAAPTAYQPPTYGLASVSAPYTTGPQASYSMPTPEATSTTAQNHYTTSRPSPNSHQQSLSSKVANGTPPTRQSEAQISTDAAYTPTPYAKFNVYRSPGPAVAAEITLPASQQPPQTQFVTVNSTTVKELAAKFPLNEDFLTSASSSTLNAGTGRSAQGFAMPGQAPPQVVDLTDHNTQQGRSTLPENWLHPNYNAAPYKQTAQPAHMENDVPIPVPGPRGLVATPAVTQRELRPQQQPAPVSYSSQQIWRPQATPLQSKSTTPATFYLPAHMASNVQPAAQKGDPPTALNLSTAPGNANPSSNSPARSTQQPLQRSPSTINAVPPGSGTPKQSSFKLKGRNGSSDTVVYSVAKASPSQSTKPITHRTSNTNLQAHASSRPDMNPARSPNATSEYPDMSRYRPQAPAAYSTPNPPYSAPATGNTFDSYSQPAPHHSRSASQPAAQNPYDYLPAAQRSQTLPSTVPPTPAAASSAAALAAAYRSGLYSTDNPARPQTAPDKRIPPRAAPSPAPSYQPQHYVPPPSVLSKTGYALPNGASQPTRGQASLAPPPAGRPNGSIMQSHSRSQSDSQNALLSARVAISGHPSTPAPTKAQLTSPSEQELLMTPSSLAPSMLKGTNAVQAPFPSSRPGPSQSSKSPKPPSIKDDRKRGGLFGLRIFRSRSSPPRPDARVAEALGSEPAVKPRQRSTSQTTINAVAASVRNIIAPHPNPSRNNAAAAQPVQSSLSTQRGSTEQPRSAAPLQTRAPTPGPANDARSMRRTAPSIVAPTPVRVGVADNHPSGRRSPGSKMFTPFRLISKRHRTVSAASNEAADGTATNTVIGGESARSSTAGRPSPPLRDPFSATQDWRNKEEAELRDRGLYRRRRPGVVFDVMDEFTDTETHQAARKFYRRPQA